MSKNSNSRREPVGAKTRATAAGIVDAVVRRGRSLEQVLDQQALDEFDAKDAAFVRALVYGALRGHYLHRELIRLLLNKPVKKKDAVLESLLSVALFQLQESAHPDFAVVSATVDAAASLGRPHARGLINAVLRNFLRRRDELVAKASQQREARYGLPGWLLDQLRNDWPESLEQIAEASLQQAPMWLRVNNMLGATADYAGILQDQTGVAATVVELSPAALLPESPVAVQQLPGFGDGRSSVQDLAAQFAAVALDPQPDELILDACAAPGGKTCHIQELTANGASVIALDESAERLLRVGENLERLGLTASVINGDAAGKDWWDGRLFDRILLDAPCSATGVIRRHPDIRLLRRKDDIAELSELQSAMLSNLWGLLKPGGYLLYTTCSVLRAENSDVIVAFLEATADAGLRSLPALDGLAQPAGEVGYQLLPGNAVNTDGFYYALMQKQ